MTYLLPAVCESTLDAARARLDRVIRSGAGRRVPATGEVILLPAVMPAGYLMAGSLPVAWPVPQAAPELVPMVLDRSHLPDQWRTYMSEVDADLVSMEEKVRAGIAGVAARLDARCREIDRLWRDAQSAVAHWSGRGLVGGYELVERQGMVCMAGYRLAAPGHPEDVRRGDIVRIVKTRRKAAA